MKKKLPFILITALVSVMITGMTAADDKGHIFSSGQKLKFSDGTDIDPPYSSFTNYIATPCVADWNGDGKKDLIVGYFYEGWIYVYLNEGTNSQPVFIRGNEILLQADGVVISVAYG